jgi:phage terminase large subunit-like protein
MTSPIALASLVDREFIESLSPIQRVVLAYKNEVWARPEQQIPAGDWRWIFFRAGRGWGKTTHCIAPWFTRLVQSGECTKLALVAPSEERADQIQVQALIDASPPWFRAEKYQGGIRWPNGVRGYVFSPGANYPRGSTFSHGWASELVDWAPSSRVKTWEQLSLTVRKPGSPQQIAIDSTASGKSDLFALLEREHKRDPSAHRMVYGTSFDNPLLSAKYLRSVCGQYPSGSRRFREEIMGESFQESAGALWQQRWIDENRRTAAPLSVRLRVVAWDPAGSARADADEAGVSVVSADDAGHFYLEIDATTRDTMAAQAELVFSTAIRTKAAGVVIERNHFNDGPRDLLTFVATRERVRIERLDSDRPMPAYRAGTLYVRELVANRNKHARAEPIAKLAESRLLHHVGYHDALELEMTTWEPDTKDSPNRLDAAVYAVAELAALSRPQPISAGEMQAYTAANRELQRRLRTDVRSRRI